MKNQNGVSTPTNSAGPEKVIVLFFVTHPKVAKPLFGPFLSRDDAECGRLAIRSAGAVVEVREVDSLDELTRIRAEAHGQVLRAFVDHQGMNHE